MFELSVGSKVFLLGEYQVLDGGSALIIVLEPRFKILVQKGTGQLQGIPMGSPAWRYHQREIAFFKSVDIQFVDPHEGRGGFGASTAQMSLLQGLREGYQSFKTHSQPDFDLRKMHKCYVELATSPTGTPPSGADWLAQVRGGLVEVGVSAGKIEWQAWPFPQWQILFFATGVKQATHEHLSGLSHVDMTSLRQIYQRAINAFLKQEGLAFVDAFREYQRELARRGWETPQTRQFLETITAMSGVIAAKGCGAMGADVLAIVVEAPKASALATEIEKLGLRYVGNLDQRTEGLTYKWLPDPAKAAAPTESPCL